MNEADKWIGFPQYRQNTPLTFVRTGHELLRVKNVTGTLPGAAYEVQISLSPFVARLVRTTTVRLLSPGNPPPPTSPPSLVPALACSYRPQTACSHRYPFPR